MFGGIVSGIVFGSIVTLGSLGLSYVLLLQNYFNFTVGSYVSLGAYLAFAFMGFLPTMGELPFVTFGPGSYLGGFGLPFPVGLLGAAIVAGIFGWLIGLPTLRLRFGFFAIATIGLGRSMVLIFKNEQWLTAGVWGIGGIPKPLSNVFPANADWAYGFLALAIMLILYFLLEKIVSSPWGRLQLAIKEDEYLTEMLSKDVWRYRMQSLVLGSMLVGIAGATYAHYQQYINPESFGDVMATFIIWVMVVAGGTKTR